MLRVENGQVCLRETSGSKVETVNVDRIDARVIHPHTQIIGDDRETLQTQLAALRKETKALLDKKEHENNSLREDIKLLHKENKKQVVAALILQSLALNSKADNFFTLARLRTRWLYQKSVIMRLHSEQQ